MISLTFLAKHIHTAFLLYAAVTATDDAAATAPAATEIGPQLLTMR